jgi:hypothetical protein
MDWWQLILALLVIAGYVIKHIVSLQQEQQRTPTLRERVKDVPRPVPAAKSDEEIDDDRTELDRRIEDAKQRRREQEDMKPASSPLPRQSIPMPAPPIIVRPLPRSQPPPVAVPRPPEIVKVAPVALPASARASSEMPRPAVVVAKPIPLAALLARDLLRNRESRAAAVLLREILDPPMSRRRYRSFSARSRCS